MAEKRTKKASKNMKQRQGIKSKRSASIKSKIDSEPKQSKREKIEIFLPEVKNRVYDHFSNNDEPKYKMGEKVFTSYNGRAFEGIIDGVDLVDKQVSEPAKDTDWGYKWMYTFSNTPSTVNINRFYEDNLYPSMEEMRKKVRHYETELEEDEMYAQGGEIKSYIQQVIENHKETISNYENLLKVAKDKKEKESVIRDIMRNIDVHRELLADAEKRARLSGWSGKTGEDFELGTPVIWGEESGELIMRDGKRAISLYPDKNYSGSEERIVFPKLQDWKDIKTYAQANYAQYLDERNIKGVKRQKALEKAEIGNFDYTLETGGTIRKVKIQVHQQTPIYATIEKDLGDKVVTNMGLFDKKHILKEFDVPAHAFMNRGGKTEEITIGDLVHVPMRNKSGVILKVDKNLVNVKFANGETESFTFNEVEKIKDEDEYSFGGKIEIGKTYPHSGGEAKVLKVYKDDGKDMVDYQYSNQNITKKETQTLNGFLTNLKLEKQNVKTRDKGDKILYTLKTKAVDTNGNKYTVYITEGKDLGNDKYHGMALSISETPGQWYLDTLLEKGMPTGELSIYGNDWILTNIKELLIEALQLIKQPYTMKKGGSTDPYDKPIEERYKNLDGYWIDDSFSKYTVRGGDFGRKGSVQDSYETMIKAFDNKKDAEKFIEKTMKGSIIFDPNKLGAMAHNVAIEKGWYDPKQGWVEWSEKREKASEYIALKKIFDYAEKKGLKMWAGGKFASGGYMVAGGKISDERIEEALRQYAETALWSSANPDKDEEFLDNNYDVKDIATSTMESFRSDVKKFYEENISAINKSGLDDGQIGHDFWLTKNHHGAGFFDRSLDDDVEKQLMDASHKFGENLLVVGDDKKIHDDYPKKKAIGGILLATAIGAIGGGFAGYAYRDNISTARENALKRVIKSKQDAIAALERRKEKVREYKEGLKRGAIRQIERLAGGGKISPMKKKLQEEVKALQSAIDGALTSEDLKESMKSNIDKKMAKISEMEVEEKEKKLRTKSSKSKSIYIDIDKKLKEKMRNAIHTEGIPYGSKTDGGTFRVFLSNQYQLDIVTRLYNEKRIKYEMKPVSKEQVTNVIKKRVGKLKFMPVKTRPNVKSKL